VVNDQLDAHFFFRICLFQFSKCFEQPGAHHQGVSSVSILLVYVYVCVCIYMCKWPSSMQARKELPLLHTRQSITQSDLSYVVLIQLILLMMSTRLLETCRDIYSGTSIYRSSINHFPAYTIRHFWSRIKFHINNVIYSRIHRSPNYRFTAFIVCKSRSQHSISRMDRLKKKLNRSIYLHYILFGLQIWQHSNAVTLPTWPSASCQQYYR
jgi:hypothetical protein